MNKDVIWLKIKFWTRKSWNGIEKMHRITVLACKMSFTSKKWQSVGFRPPRSLGSIYMGSTVLWWWNGTETDLWKVDQKWKFWLCMRCKNEFSEFYAYLVHIYHHELLIFCPTNIVALWWWTMLWLQLRAVCSRFNAFKM